MENSEGICSTGNQAIGAARARCESQDELAKAVRRGFTLVKQLGTAGSARFFLAQCPGHSQSPETLVRLKVLAEEAADDPESVDLFYLEALACNRLAHKSCLTTSEAVEVCGSHLTASEYKPGLETLRERLDRLAWLDVGEAIRISYDVSLALEEAHGKGVLHLNLSPINILVGDEDAAALVSEFGIETAAALEWARRLRSKRQGPLYASPEQALGADLDGRSDLYTLGVVLFEMLTDRTPLCDKDCEAIHSRGQASINPARSLKLYRPDIPDSLSITVMKLLERNPDARFQSAKELSLALESLMKPVSAAAPLIIGSASLIKEIEPEPSNALSDLLGVMECGPPSNPETFELPEEWPNGSLSTSESDVLNDLALDDPLTPLDVSNALESERSSSADPLDQLALEVEANSDSSDSSMEAGSDSSIDLQPVYSDLEELPPSGQPVYSAEYGSAPKSAFPLRWQSARRRLAVGGVLAVLAAMMLLANSNSLSRAVNRADGAAASTIAAPSTPLEQKTTVTTEKEDSGSGTTAQSNTDAAKVNTQQSVQNARGAAASTQRGLNSNAQRSWRKKPARRRTSSQRWTLGPIWYGK